MATLVWLVWDTAMVVLIPQLLLLAQLLLLLSALLLPMATPLDWLDTDMVLDSGDCGSVMLRLTPKLRPGTPMATLVLLVWDMAMVVLTPQLPLLAQLLLLPLSALLLPMATPLDWLD